MGVKKAKNKLWDQYFLSDIYTAEPGKKKYGEFSVKISKFVRQSQNKGSLSPPVTDKSDWTLCLYHGEFMSSDGILMWVIQ